MSRQTGAFNDINSMSNQVISPLFSWCKAYEQVGNNWSVRPGEGSLGS